VIDVVRSYICDMGVHQCLNKGVRHRLLYRRFDRALTLERGFVPARRARS
jgi:hypothetical protein